MITLSGLMLNRDFFLYVFPLLFLSGCGYFSDKNSNMVVYSRAISPSGSFEAKLLKYDEANGGLGATYSVHYKLIISHESNVNEPEDVLTADKNRGLVLIWRDRTTLEVCYEDVQIFNFRNRVNFIHVDDLNYPNLYEAEVVLRRVDNLSKCDTAKVTPDGEREHKSKGPAIVNLPNSDH